MLVLLIIFMITAPMLQQGLDVNLPVASGTSQTEQEEQLILVTSRGRFFSIKRPINWRRCSPSCAPSQARPDRDVFLRADSSVPYGTVVQVMDEVKKAGIIKLGMITTSH